jgi:hypothetical protein
LLSLGWFVLSRFVGIGQALLGWFVCYLASFCLLLLNFKELPWLVTQGWLTACCS